MTITCDNCGLCCMHMVVPPFSTDSPPAELDAQLLAFERSPRWCADGQPCCWLDLITGKCRHYEHRPEVCREFEVGGEACMRIRREANLQENLVRSEVP